MTLESNKSKEKQGVATRVAAAHVLAEVLERHLILDDALEDAAAKARLSDEDRRLVHAICGFVFRNLRHIDSVILAVMNRKRSPSPRLLHQLLRVGVAQVLYMDVAEHAAVHATVSAVGSLRLNRQKGLVNAVLRAVQRQKVSFTKDSNHALSALPEWLSARWVRNFGEDEAKAIATVMAQEAPLDITIKDSKASLEWGQKLGGECLATGSVRVVHRAGRLASWPGFEEGAWWVQDLAAFLTISMLDDVAGKSVLDMCAAPGGKTMQLAAKGARVTAVDLSASRMQRVTENLARVGLAHDVKTVVADAGVWETDSCFDVIVCDAPCTSTGTLRRHPELPWNHEEKELEKTTASQRALLTHASKLLQPKGRILYCTCSMEVEEGENQVELFLSEHKDFKEVTAISSLAQPFLKRGVRNVGWRTDLAGWAAKGGMDGFFMALLEKQ